MKLGFIGFGEAAYALCKGFAETAAQAAGKKAEDGAGEAAVLGEASARPDLFLAACSRSFSYRGKPEEVGVVRCASYEELAQCCDTIFVTTPNVAALPTARAMAPYLRPGMLYADLTSAAPKLMEQAAAAVEGSGALFADAAMLDSLPKFRNNVRVVVSGSGAEEFLRRTDGWLLRAEKVGDRPGEASAIKMLRSLYTKAHLAIAFDMLQGAAAYGVEDYVMKSLAETMDGKDFISGMDERTSSGIIHAARRADELEMAAGMLADAGLDPSLTMAAVEKLRSIGRLDLKNRIQGERPSTWKDALQYIKDKQ